MLELSGKERLIVALDVSSADEALDLVDRLGDTVSFFKVGWQLFIAGEWRRIVEELHQKHFFVDLKFPGDIDNTIASVVEVCTSKLRCVKFITLSEGVSVPTIKAAVKARIPFTEPKLLVVPLYSSLDEKDFEVVVGQPPEKMNDFILDRANTMLGAGVDGLIASGPQIRLLRKAHQNAVIVSPAIRPSGTSPDDHKRFTTPSQAIRFGADYLVVGRPIRNAPDPKEAARAIIDEIEGALGPETSRSRRPCGSDSSGYSAQPLTCQPSED